tara:strand:+ start:2455 stop:2799 length:345 start_codon:yes stop_codon:yes gene_type:complete
MKENPHLVKLVQALKKKSIEDNAGLWKRVATDLEKSTRQRRVVNLSRIDRFTKDNEVVVVPGKVLGDGTLTKKVTVAAYSFSNTAKDKLSKAQSQILTIEELMQKNPKDIKVIG